MRVIYLVFTVEPGGIFIFCVFILQRDGLRNSICRADCDNSDSDGHSLSR